MNPESFAEHFHILAEAPNGIQKLREMVLQLAVQGKLVPQNPQEEPASVLLKKIGAEKEKLFKEGKISKQKPLPPINPDDVAYELPKGWEWVKLTQLGITQTGTTPPKNHPEYYGSGHPFIKPADIFNSGVDYTQEQITDLGLANGRLIPANSALMVCIGGSIGKVGYVDRNCSCNQQINFVSPLAGMDARFIAYWMKTPYFQREVLARAPQTTLPILSKGKWEVIEFPLPPLAEQKHIVAKVDQLMALCNELDARQQKCTKKRITLNTSCLNDLTSPDVDLAENAWQRISDSFDLIYDFPESVSELRQAILQLAVMGRLVSQDPKEEPASVLMKKIKSEKEKLIKEGKISKSKPLPPIDPDEVPYGLPKGWEWVRLPEIFFSISPGQKKVKTKDVNKTGKYPVVDQGQSYIAGYVDDSEKLIQIPGPVVVFGDHTRAFKLVDFDFVVGADGTKILRPVFLNEQYFYWGLRSYTLEDRGYGRHYKILKGQLFPLPSLAEQKRIVVKVDQFMALCAELETKLKQSQSSAEMVMGAMVNELTTA